MKKIHPLLLLMLLPLSGCIDESPTATLTEAGLFRLLGEFVIEPGEVITLSGERAQRIFLPGGGDGAEYIIVPFNAQGEGGTTVEIEIEGGDLRQVVGPPNAQATPADGRLAALAAGRVHRDRNFHLGFLQRQRRHFQRMVLPSGSRARSRAVQQDTEVAAQQSVPSVGDVIPLNIPTAAALSGGGNICEDFLRRGARVVAVSEHLIIAVDTANPTSDFSESAQRIAARFEELVYPVNTTNFGGPSDIDENGRVIAFFTEVVNRLTPPGANTIVGGFFFSGDLFPSDQDDDLPPPAQPLAVCDVSNEAELFYLRAADPTGEINNNPVSAEVIVLGALGTIGHEFQHLINASREIYVVTADGQILFELGWLNEGLSHIAEELLFYAASEFEPRTNIDIDALLRSESTVEALNRYQLNNLARYYTYVENPDTTSLFGITDLSTRGAAWAFLRYAADLKDGPDQPFFFDLVNAQSTGLITLENVLEIEPLDLIQTWTVSIYSDDVPTIPDAELPNYLTQPSWDFRSILADFDARFFDGPGEYPLAIERLEGDVIQLTLEPGGTAFVRLEVSESVRAEITTTTAAGPPPAALRVSVVRIQ